MKPPPDAVPKLVRAWRRDTSAILFEVDFQNGFSGVYWSEVEAWGCCCVRSTAQAFRDDWQAQGLAPAKADRFIQEAWDLAYAAHP